MKMKSFIATAVLAAVMALGVATTNAAMVIKFDDGVTILLVVDGSALDVNPAVGAITFVGSHGFWDLNVTTGFSDPNTGPLPKIDLNSLSATTSGTVAGTLTVSLTDTDFDWTSAFSVQNVIGGVTDGTLTNTFGWDSSNAEFGFSTSAMVGPFGSGGFNNSAFLPGGLFGPDPAFSLTTSVAITHGVGDFNTSFNSTVGIPAPGAVLLGMMGLGMVGWVKRRFA